MSTDDPGPALVRRIFAHRLATADLTPRQREVLARLAAGDKPCEIGDRLSIDRETVDNHLWAIRLRLSARTSCHAVMIVLGLSQPDDGSFPP